MKKELIEVLEIIEDKGYECYLVGGFPRDYYLGRKTDDFDICTNARPEIIRDLFDVVREESFGSLAVKYKKLILEITTYRQEEGYTSVRDPIVSYTDTLVEDLKRRDFTINSICMDKTGKHIDLLNGIDDIHNRMIRCVGDPLVKLSEDPLRILRALRFATVLNFVISDDLDQAILTLAYKVSSLSFYRKKDELGKIFASENMTRGLSLLNKYELGEYLDLDLSNVVPAVNPMEIWAQIPGWEKYPFTKQEKRAIELIIKNRMN